jgi:hypothetical protein
VSLFDCKVAQKLKDLEHVVHGHGGAPRLHHQGSQLEGMGRGDAIHSQGAKVGQDPKAGNGFDFL